MGEYPVLPADDLEAGGWEERVRTESTVFQTPTASVVGRTVLYEDAALAAALSAVDADELLASRAEAGGDRLVDTDGTYWRFVFATALSFRPPLAPGIGPASMRPTVVAEARSSFADDLEARGFEDVDRGRTQRARTDGGDRVSLAKFTASYPFEDAASDRLDVEGWLGVWSTGGTFRIAGGVYPVRGLEPLLSALPEDERPAIDPTGYRNELLDLLRAVT